MYVDLDGCVVQFFVEDFFSVFCRHAARAPITSGAVPGGVQKYEDRKRLSRRHSRNGPWT